MTTFKTRNLHVAGYLLTLGAPFPTTTNDDLGAGLATFEFVDPNGEWRREASKLNLHDAESDVCHVPCARFIAALALLRYEMGRVLGRRRR